MIDDILSQVQKPARYIGSEWNASRKDFDKAGIKFALSFPDLYEVGMSNLGVRIIYGLLNNMPDVSCERIFSCGVDLEKILLEKGLQTSSLESGRRLPDFDIVGFSLGYELGYTNVLKILDLGGIPLHSALRDNNFPLVIGGGPCALNPEPMQEFFDLFIIGEAEEAILEFVEAYRKFKEDFKSGKLSKEELLLNFSAIPGVYVPSLYGVSYYGDGRIKEFRAKSSRLPQEIQKRVVRDLDAAYFPDNWLLPYIQIVHDRLMLEIMRGCPNSCRFCQARLQYFPLRLRSIKNINNLARDIYRRTGYEEISLCGLSVSDFPDFTGLLKELVAAFKQKAVSISLPSLKAKAMIGEAAEVVSTIKKTGLTFAPEAGTERMRKLLGKPFDENEFLHALLKAYQAGYQHVKLYFMIGLPHEGKEDLDGILEFATAASLLRKKTGKPPAQVNISINTLIPKPHTAFQWFGMEGLEGVKEKQDYLKSRNKNKRLKFSFHNRQMSFLEGVFSRGDRRLGKVILGAYRRGARFDAWSEHFDFQRWMDSFKEAGIEPEFYLQEKAKDGILPWDFIDVGVGKESLLKENVEINTLASSLR